MRENKFRAWDKENKAMIYSEDSIDDFVFIADENGLKFYYIDTNHYLKDSNSDVMQYTGLKDIKRMEIYESDYVRGFHRNFEVGNLVEVTFLNGCFMFGTYNAHEFFNMHQHIEVVGNVFENTEPMEVE